MDQMDSVIPGSPELARRQAVQPLNLQGPTHRSARRIVTPGADLAGVGREPQLLLALAEPLPRLLQLSDVPPISRHTDHLARRVPQRRGHASDLDAGSILAAPYGFVMNCRLASLNACDDPVRIG